jgi:hypothetical protein
MERKEGKMEDTELTFAHAHTVMYPNRHVQGPEAVQTDHRLVAGLLFEHHNDHSRRFLVNKLHDWPYVEITWYRDFTLPHSKRIFVAKDIPSKLLAEHAVEGNPELGYTDMEKLRLTNKGGKLVLMEWFVGEELSITDALQAGATFSLREGLRWNE